MGKSVNASYCTCIVAGLSWLTPLIYTISACCLASLPGYETTCCQLAHKRECCIFSFSRVSLAPSVCLCTCSCACPHLFKVCMCVKVSMTGFCVIPQITKELCTLSLYSKHNSYTYVSVTPPHTHTRISYHDIYRTLVVSSFGKLSAVAAMVWTGDFHLWLPTLLVLPAQLQAFRGNQTTGLGPGPGISNNLLKFFPLSPQLS